MDCPWTLGRIVPMTTTKKVLLGIALALPPMAYVAGAIAAPSDDPAPRDTIVVTQTPGADPTSPPTPSRNASPSPSPSDDDCDDDGDGRGLDDDGDDDAGIEVVIPCP